MNDSKKNIFGRMFKAVYSSVEELPQGQAQIKSDQKEKLVTTILHLLILLTVASFIIWAYFSFNEKETFAEQFMNVFKYCLSILVGYVLGFNKNR